MDKRGETTSARLFITVVIIVLIGAIAYILVQDHQKQTNLAQQNADLEQQKADLEQKNAGLEQQIVAIQQIATPGSNVGGMYVLSSPFYLSSATAKSTGVTLEIKNNGGDDATINNVAVGGCGTSSSISKSVPAGSLATVTVSCSLASGSTFSGDITVTYLKTGSSLASQSTGTISIRVS